MTADRPTTEPRTCHRCSHPIVAEHRTNRATPEGECMYCRECSDRRNSRRRGGSIDPADPEGPPIPFAEAAQGAAPHPRTYSLVGAGGPDKYLVTDDESGINIGYARKVGGPITAPIRGAAPRAEGLAATAERERVERLERFVRSVADRPCEATAFYGPGGMVSPPLLGEEALTDGVERCLDPEWNEMHDEATGEPITADDLGRCDPCIARLALTGGQSDER